MSLRLVLLAVLSKQANSGYGISKALRTSLRHLWEARLQQIYAELGRAQEQGLVDVREIELPNRPAKKVYSLTPDGENALDAWLADRADAYVPKDDLLVKLYCLERAAPASILRQLADRQERFAGRVEELRARIAQVPRTEPGALGELITVEAALARAEAEITWCQRAMTLVQEDAAPAAEAGSEAASA